MIRNSYSLLLFMALTFASVLTRAESSASSPLSQPESQPVTRAMLTAPANVQSATVTNPVTGSVKVTLALGMGFHLCLHSKTLPDIGVAFECSGMLPDMQTIEVELIEKPAAKPTWHYYEATVKDSVDFQDLKGQVEILVAYGVVDGRTYAFIDGRIITEKKGKFSAPIYFRSSAPGGFDKLTYSSSYGLATVIDLNSKTKGDWSPYVALRGAVQPSTLER